MTRLNKYGNLPKYPLPHEVSLKECVLSFHVKLFMNFLKNYLCLTLLLYMSSRLHIFGRKNVLTLKADDVMMISLKNMYISEKLL